jgi:hypothetical protein
MYLAIDRTCPSTTDIQTHGDSYGARGSGIDRTGPLDQEAHKYESTGAGGPTSSGAAGTDRFDVSRDRSGATGDSYGATDSYPEYKEGEKDANKKGSGGIGGLVSLALPFVEEIY